MTDAAPTDLSIAQVLHLSQPVLVPAPIHPAPSDAAEQHPNHLLPPHYDLPSKHRRVPWSKLRLIRLEAVALPGLVVMPAQ